MNRTQDIAKPFRMHPTTPSATVVVKKIFFLPLWSASTPMIGPRMATMTVTTEMAIA